MTTPILGSAVFQRTINGQQELLAACIPLSVTARRLLHLVNGNTPLGVFAEMLRSDAVLLDELQELMESGLVVRAPPAAAMLRKPAGVRPVTWMDGNAQHVGASA